MAAKPETNFTNRLRKKLPKSIYVMKNNNGFVGGIPDLWVSGSKNDLWIEAKYVDPLPVNVPVRVNKLLSALQLEWLNARCKEGRNVCVMVGCKGGGVLLRQYAWDAEIPVSHFKSLIRSDADLAEWIREQVEL